MSIDLVPLLAAVWTESDTHIKPIGLMTITMKKNNSNQTKGKPWTESVKMLHKIVRYFACLKVTYLISGNLNYIEFGPL